MTLVLLEKIVVNASNQRLHQLNACGVTMEPGVMLMSR